MAQRSSQQDRHNSSGYSLPKTGGFKLRVFMKWILLGTSSTFCLWPTLGEKSKRKQLTSIHWAEPHCLELHSLHPINTKGVRGGLMVLACFASPSLYLKQITVVPPLLAQIVPWLIPPSPSLTWWVVPFSFPCKACSNSLDFQKEEGNIAEE